MNGWGAIKGTIKKQIGRTPIIGAHITTNTGKSVYSNSTDGSYGFPHPIDLNNPVSVTCDYAPFQSQTKSVLVDSITTKKVPFLLS
jgi:hypothetical protein